MTRRVVVTGLGLVTPVGNDVESTWSALLAGTPGAAPIKKFDPAQLSVRFACEVKGFDPLQYIDKKEARRYDLFAQFALAAAHQAVTQAGLDREVPAPNRTGVVIGSGIGGHADVRGELHGRTSPRAPTASLRSSCRCSSPTSPPGLVSIRYGLKGPNFATVSACASSAHAIGESFNLIRHGRGRRDGHRRRRRHPSPASPWPRSPT